MDKDQLKLEILQMLDRLVCNSEKMITQSDDPSGMFNEYVIDSESFRANIAKEIEELESRLDPYKP